jgi:DNA invertase Pin-like site-specific DNA recombinase
MGVETPKRAVIYGRVSTAEQAETGLGLESQRRKCEAFCEANGWEVRATFEDAGISGKTSDRPGLNAALAALGPGDVLLVLKLDRLTRRVAHLEPLIERVQKAGATWATVQERYDTGSANGRFMLGIMLQLSQWEREVIAERTSAALAVKRDRRERLGTTPLGFRTEKGRVSPVPDEQAAVRRARDLYASGLSLRKVAGQLEGEGHKTKRGGRWAAETVRLLLAPRYLERIASGME